MAPRQVEYEAGFENNTEDVVFPLFAFYKNLVVYNIFKLKLRLF